MVSTYSKPKPGEEVVVTGISGKFANSNDINNFKDNLFNKVDFISKTNPQCDFVDSEITYRTGKLLDIDKFDAGFFGVSQKYSSYMNPMLRMTLERVYEALVDAGHHPFDLEGSNTIVYVGTTAAGNDVEVYSKVEPDSGSIMGYQLSMIAKQVCYFFKLNGTGFTTDTACCSAVSALEHAYRYLREGKCQKAIVCGTHLCMHSSMQFFKMGVLSPDETCRSFDDAGNGYIRSEAITAIVLEKLKDAKRVYAEVIHCKTNCDGYKEEGITFPSAKIQIALIKELYQECNVDRSSLTFVEAHATGTRAGDAEELKTIAECFCKGNNKPLYIGSVKPNIGHTEPASGICSIIKIIVSFENGFIPPNINYSNPRKGVDALENGSLVVVTEKMPLPNDNVLIGANSFGFGGSNGHAIFRWNAKAKINQGIPIDDLPRLVCVSGRSYSTVTSTLDKAAKVDAEFIGLIHQVFRKTIPDQLYHGFSIVCKQGVMERMIHENKTIGNRLRVVFTNMDGKWHHDLGEQLMDIQLYSDSIKRIHTILKKEFCVDVPKINNEIFVTIIVQLTLANMVKELNIEFYEVIGTGYGELIAAYLCEFLSLKDVVLISYYLLLGNTSEINRILHEKPLHFNKWKSVYTIDKLHPQGSLEYFLKAVSNPISREELVKVKTSKKRFSNLIIGPWKENHGDNDVLLVGNTSEPITELLRSLGRLFLMGFPANIAKLYPKISYPVSRGTAMLSPLIKWNHSKSYAVAYHETGAKEYKECEHTVQVSVRMENWQFISGHVIDGRNLFPASGYMILVWEYYAKMLGKTMTSIGVIFENVRFHRAANIPSEGALTFKIIIQTESQLFEIIENSDVLVTGMVYKLNEEHKLSKVSSNSTDETVLEMNKRDVYKELRLRGYYYDNEFKEIERYNSKLNKAIISWKGNWITFIDNMLQVQLLSEDTRDLYIQTSIKKVVIDPYLHNRETFSFHNQIPVFYNQQARLISGGGIEVTQLDNTAIPRRSPVEPVLETYKFIPYQGKLVLDQAVRCVVQTVIENTNRINMKAIELINDDKDDEPLMPLIQHAMKDIPLIQPELTIFSKKKNLNFPGIAVESKSLHSQTGCLILIATDILRNRNLLSTAFKATRDFSGFIITKESKKIPTDTIEHLQVLCSYDTELGNIMLIKESSKYVDRIPINISSIDDLSWIKFLQSSLNKNVVLYTEKNSINGTLAFVKCLRKENSGYNISAMLIVGDAPSFNIDDDFYKSQLRKNVAINIYQNGKWGSYKYLPLPNIESVENEHSYADTIKKGDLLSLQWIQGHLSTTTRSKPETQLVHVNYSAINIRDIMITERKLPFHAIVKNKVSQECIQGIEFSGGLVNQPSKRVMGMAVGGALATMVMANTNLLWSVPKEWSLEDAATIPIAYGTAFYALIMRGKIKRGQRILIHSGSGDIGQAAINVASYLGCTVFTTVDNRKQREFIERYFPQIKNEHVGDSSSILFEQMIHKGTQGKGVDFVLNSLSEEKMLASIRCLAYNGTCVEIGKFDMARDNRLGIMLLKRQARYEGVTIEQLFTGSNETKQALGDLIKEGVSNGCVKPLIRTVFAKNKLQQAYRYVSSEDHIGKVVVKVHEANHKLHKSIPRFSCNHLACYIILGGLGGFGLELANWLITRGARHLIFTSRSGVKNGYQLYRLNVFQSYGVSVSIRNDEVATKEGCETLLKFAESLGPIEGIFNVAVVLQDALFENQTPEKFKTCLMPKAYATRNLDIISRKICPSLRYFVVFSSGASGRGNAGQTSYGMANSIMEQICEKRKKDGYPALEIKWGAIGDVGIVAEMQDGQKEITIEGTSQQKMWNCLQVLDRFLTQNEVIVSSIILVEKKTTSAANNMFDAVLTTVGVKNLKTVSVHSTFAELGMDSMMVVELKQTLEREYQIFLATEDIRNMTIRKLEDLATQQLEGIATLNQNVL